MISTLATSPQKKKKTKKLHGTLKCPKLPQKETM